jgi:2-phosphoglycerate kinase
MSKLVIISGATATGKSELAIEVAKETMVSNALKDVMKQFDKNYQISKSELTTYVKKHFNS